MSSVVLGLLAVVVGALFCFRGWVLLRVIIPIWGAFAGFMLGAGLVASWTDEGFLATVAGWLFGLLLAVVFGLLAYLYYELSIFIAMGAIGFSISTTVLVALGVTWSWVIVLVGLAAAMVLALVSIIADMPMIVLVVLSALAGASVVVTGVMLVFDVIETGDLTSAATTQGVDDDWWWYALYGVLAITGIVAQIRATDRIGASMREAWVASGGHELRST